MTAVLSVFLLYILVVILGAQWLVAGSSSLAKRLKLPSIFIGLTVVSFGTSLPELIISFFSLKSNLVVISVGNLIGANIANIGLIVGLAALVRPLVVRSLTTHRELPLMFISLLMAAILGADILLNGADFNSFSRADGLILLIVFSVFAITILAVIRSVHGAKTAQPTHSLLKEGLMIGGGCLALAIGGQGVVSSAQSIASIMQVSTTLVGLTLVALGTTFPELVTAVIAAKRGEVDIAIGNMVGSVLFNTTFILGLLASFSRQPIPLPDSMILDLSLMTLFGVMIYSTTLQDRRITRSEGSFLIVAYLLYLTFTYLRG